MEKQVTARAVHDLLFCERSAHIMYAQSEFEDNHFTVDGRAVHRRADEEKALPQAEHLDDRPYRARAVWLSSGALGITAKVDVVEVENGEVGVVEYKRGALPEKGVYLSDQAQVCIHVLLCASTATSSDRRRFILRPPRSASWSKLPTS